MKQFLLLMLAVLTLGSCNKDAIEDLQSDVAGLVSETGFISAALAEANAAYNTAIEALNAALAANEVLTAENAALIAANMTEIEANYDAIVEGDTLSAEELADVRASIDGVKDEVMAYVNEQIAELNAELEIAIADGDKDAIADLQAQIAYAVSAAGLRGADGADGQDGQNGAPGQTGAPGQAGTPGNDGAPGADGTGSGTSYDDTAVRGLISALETTINGLGAHTDITQLQSDLAAITAELANIGDSYDDTTILTLIEELRAEVAVLSAAITESGIDLPDFIVYSDYDHSANVPPTAEITKGNLISEITEGTSADEFLTVTTTHEQFSNVAAYSYFKTRTGTVSVVGTVDDPAPVAEDLSVEVLVDATSTQIGNSVVVTNPTNPNYDDGSAAAAEAARLAAGLAAASFSPAFTNQTADFTQTKTFETVSDSRIVNVTSSGGGTTTQNSTEIIINEDVNGDLDKLDEISRQRTAATVYSASIGGSHSVGGSDGDWSVSVDNDPAAATTGTVTLKYTGTSGDALLGVEIFVDNVSLGDSTTVTFEATAGVSYYIVIARTGANVEVYHTFTEADLSDGEATIDLNSAGAKVIS